MLIMIGGVLANTICKQEQTWKHAIYCITVDPCTAQGLGEPNTVHPKTLV